MTVNKVSATNVKCELPPVLWVRPKAVYSTSWRSLVLIREKSIAVGFPVHSQPAGRQNRNIISIILTSTGDVLFL